MENIFKTTCVLCLLLLGFNGNAQQDWRAGHLVTNDSTTIKGQILFEDWDVSPQSIQFKDETGVVTKRSAQEIKSFQILDPIKNFESKNLVLGYYSTNIVPEGASPIARTESVSVFLEVLLKSNIVTLYECMDDEKNPRFFLRKDTALHELRNTVYRGARGETSHLIKGEIYKAQLKQLLLECPTLETDHVGYSDVEIIRVLEKYLRYCKTDFQTEFQQHALGERLAFGALYRYAPEYSSTPNFVGLNLILFSKKKFNSLFVSIEMGAGLGGQDEVATDDDRSLFYFGLYGGKSFGLGDWHPVVYTGISNINGALDTGVGISYQRIVHASVSAGLIHLTKGVSSWSFQLKFTPFTKKSKA